MPVRAGQLKRWAARAAELGSISFAKVFADNFHE